MNFNNRSFKKNALLALLALEFVIFKPSASLAVSDAAKQKAQTCVACHGESGISNNDLWPNLAGQKQAYLKKQLRDFQSGARQDPVMTPISKILSEQEIDLVSEYFSGQVVPSTAK